MFEQEIFFDVLNNKVWLDQECWNCSKWELEDKRVCEYCNGKGFLPTDVGNEILAFLYRHSKLEEENV